MQLNKIHDINNNYVFNKFFDNYFTEDCIICEAQENKTPTSISIKEKEGEKLLRSEIKSVLKKEVKRATVVGNPMFSNTTYDHVDSRDDLVLDGFEMDYEQIMHYFDNLKVC